MYVSLLGIILIFTFQISMNVQIIFTTVQLIAFVTIQMVVLIAAALLDSFLLLVTVMNA